MDASTNDVVGMLDGIRDKEIARMLDEELLQFIDNSEASVILVEEVGTEEKVATQT